MNKSIMYSHEGHCEKFGFWPDCTAACATIAPFGAPFPHWQRRALRGDEPFREWRRAIPDPVVALVTRFPEIHWWALLQLAGRDPEWFLALERYPLYLIHVLALRHGRILEDEVFRLSVKEVIANTTILPRAIFRRVPAFCASAVLLQGITKAWPLLPMRVQKSLRMCRAVTLDTSTALAVLPAECLTPALVTACETSTCLEMTQACCTIVELQAGPWKYGQVSEPETLIHLALSLEEKVRADLFPPPPFKGWAGIVPLTTNDELAAEGGEMQNCVADLHDEITAGHGYVYRVTAPDRATLYLCREPFEGSWKCGALVSTGNRRASPATVRIVDLWLREHGLDLIDEDSRLG